MLLFIMFLICFGNILDIVMIDDEFMHMFAKRLAQYSSGLSGRHYVSMVLKYCLPYVEQVEHRCEGRQALFLIFLSNVPYA